MRHHTLAILVAAHVSRAALGQAAESSHLDAPLADAELQRSLDARVTVASSHASLHLYTAGDLLARSTALGYAMTYSVGEGAAECHLHDGTCPSGIALGLEVYGALGDSASSLDPRAQPHLFAVVATLPLCADLVLHAQLARAVLEEETVGQVLLAAEF